jgi:glycosyltransferase involved in cell wall biosynthesis
LTLHDVIYLEKLDFQGTAYQNFGNLYRRFVVPRIVNHCRTIITVSHFEREAILRTLNLPEERVKVIYNAVNAKFNNNYPAEQLESFREEYKLPEEFILFLGNTAPKKNTINVIKAYSEYCLSTKEHIPLVILDYERQLVLEALEKLGREDLIDNFIFPGYISSDNMPLMYNCATLFLYPSLRESFGLPLLEAMACNTPVITSNTSSMPEISGDAAQLVDPMDYIQITEAICTVLGNNQLREDMKRKGLVQAAKFTWEASARDLISTYECAAVA